MVSERALTFAKRLDARLKQASNVDVYVLDPLPVKPTRGYACGDVAPAMEWRDRASDDVGTRTLLFSIRCCGFTPGQALNTADQVLPLLSGWEPFPEDPSSGRARMTGAFPVEKDDSIPTDVRYFTTSQYTVD